jgi:threonylcarbamoyladenosine tRNA methylthiotransferase MtaB
MIADSGAISRIRLSSLDPREVPDRLLDLMARCPTICPHLHVCAQAGDDQILKAMRRNYDQVYYRELLTRVRERLPDAALGSDIIVGFPGESDEQFENSLAYFDSLPLTYFHVFPYSSRRTTVAAAMLDHVAGAVKKNRARRMRELGLRKKQEFYSRFVGGRAVVLTEDKVDPISGARRGLTRNYLSVAFSGADDSVNREVEVQLSGYRNGWLTGSAADSEPVASDVMI